MSGTDPAKQFFAHSKGASGTWQTMAEHTSGVVERATEFAGAFGRQDDAEIAATFHDLGKYSELFQQRLHGQGKGLDHWSMGAWAALTKARCVDAALAIQGHHIGLQQMDKRSLGLLHPSKLAVQDPREGRVTEPDLDLLLGRLQRDGFNVDTRTSCTQIFQGVGAMLDTRMLYSSLVDADYLDTSAHFDGVSERAVPALQADRALQLVAARVEELSCGSNARQALTHLRRQVWESCLDGAVHSPGVFTLSAPTGSGKTLAMMGFALKHAALHNLRRVVIVLPYLNIIEQTAEQYRTLFDPEFGGAYLLEHHSLTPFETGIARDQDDAGTGGFARFQAENWDAPIVVTTTVQLLESLFSNRPATCRKLHRLAQSVILFDEAQSLPQKLLLPTLAALCRLAGETYHSSVVFATATQPAFGHLHTTLVAASETGFNAREIIPARLQTARALKRTVVSWPNPEESLVIDELAMQIADYPQALCIVNTRAAARQLAKILRSIVPDALPVYHLSTSMCPQHRKDVLNTVRRCLSENEDVLLVATQCVEAGVDIDFPVVYRAFAPLEAVIQAAGRCNRNGNMSQPGVVNVFRLSDERFPDATYKQAADVTRSLLARYNNVIEDVNDPSLIHQYYRELYDLNRPEERARALNEAIQTGDFVSVAREYRVIEQQTVNVLVPYMPLSGTFRRLVDSANERGIDRRWLREVSPLSAGMYLPYDKDDSAHQAVMQLRFTDRYRAGELAPYWYVMLDSRHYNETLGIDISSEQGTYVI